MAKFALQRGLDTSSVEGYLAQQYLDQTFTYDDAEVFDVPYGRGPGLTTVLPTENEPSIIQSVQEALANVPRWRLHKLKNIDVATGDSGALKQVFDGQPVRHMPRWRGPLSRVIREVGRLSDGWGGPGSVAPSSAVIRAMQALASILPPGTKEPAAEIDIDDGSITLTWANTDRSEAFNLTLFNSGNVGGAHADLHGTSLPAWINSIGEHRKLSAHLNDQRVLALLCG